MRLVLNWDKRFDKIGIQLTDLGLRVRNIASNGVAGISKKALKTLTDLTPAESENATGKLKSSWKLKRRKLPYGILFEIRNVDPRAHEPIIYKGGKTTLLQILEYGTSLHTIEPKRARMLRFEVHGTEIFTLKSAHPGQRPYAMVRVTHTEAVRQAVGLIKTIQLIMSRYKPTSLV